ncbi:MAG: glycosyltransferase family 4 protein [Elusimicrobiota bacterium]|jgi:glycosyltransferase involved in cell wall biosynthesis
MERIVFIGSHLGYPMDRTPLGGGAMVGLRLARRWARERACELTVLGSGPLPPAESGEYVRLPADCVYEPVHLSEFEYARFCRDFEAATTDWLLSRRGRFAPGSTCVLVNDVSEGPTLAALAAAGYPIVSIWHVDVVDYFNKLYLRNWVRPERLTRLYERCCRMGIARAVPDLLRIVFEKQQDTVRYSNRLIVPSRGMAETLTRCYGGLWPEQALPQRIQVVPWGAFEDEAPGPAPEARIQELRARYGIGPDTAVLMTLSRISPEKGIHLLLEGLRLLEGDGRLRDRDVVLLVCGDAAFMQGARYMRRVRAAAGKLKRVRVFFPGYLDAAAKKAHFPLAQLFISPSVHESYGLNVAEAMQAGLAVLASDHYGVREMLDEGCGRAVSYADLSAAPARLAEALAGLISERDKLLAMGRKSRERAEAMPFARAADAILAACRELWGRPAGPAAIGVGRRQDGG